MVEFIIGFLILWEIYRLFNVDNAIAVKKYLSVPKPEREKLKIENPLFERKAGQFVSFSMLAGVSYVLLLIYSMFFSSLTPLFWSIGILLVYRFVMNAVRDAFAKHQSPEQNAFTLKSRLYFDAAVAITLMSLVLLPMLGVAI